MSRQFIQMRLSMQQYQLSEATRKVINSRVGETLRLLQEASQNLADSEGKSLSNAERYAVVIEALQFVIRNRDPNIDPPQNYTKGHQLLADVDGKLESVYDNPATLDENLQGQTITSSVQLYLRTLIRACIANIEADFSAILREVNKNFPTDTNDEKKNVPVVPANTQVVPTNVQNNLPAQNDLSTSAAIISALPPVMAAASSSSSPQIMGMNPEYDYLFRIHLIGAKGTGKTSIYNCYAGQAFNANYVSTFKDDFISRMVSVDDKEIKLLVSDKSSLNYLFHGRIHLPNCLLYVVDITDRKTFEQILELAKEQPLFLPAVLAVTKCDLMERRVVSQEEIQKLAYALGIKEIIEVSAKTGNNISHLFERVAFFSLEYIRNKGNFDSRAYEEDVMKRIANYKKSTSSSAHYSSSSSSAFFPASNLSLLPSSSGASNPDYDYLLKPAIVGASGAGKSSIINHFVNKKFSDNHSNTIGHDFVITQTSVRGKNIKLQIWDIPEPHKPISHFRGAHGVIVVFDVTNRESFESVNHFIKLPLFNDHIPYILVGTKSDKYAQRVVSEDEMNIKAKELGFSSAIEVSSKTGNNIQELFNLYTIIVLNKLCPDLFPLIEPPKEPSKEGCCVM